MRIVVVAAAFLVLVQQATADVPADFTAAMAKWRASAPPNYTFIYHLGGAVIIAPRCADALIKVTVRGGVSAPPVVVKGGPRCPAGTHGEKEIGFAVPGSIEAAFAEMRRYIEAPPVPAKITATYDAVLGYPTKYYVEKLEVEDNDEGFEITGLEAIR